MVLAIALQDVISAEAAALPVNARSVVSPVVERCLPPAPGRDRRVVVDEQGTLVVCRGEALISRFEARRQSVQ